MKPFATALSCLLLVPTAGTAQPAADPADVASPEALVTALYETVQRAPGAAYQWDRMRTLFLPGARLIPNTEQSGGQFRVLTVEEFIAWIDEITVVGGPDDQGFAEEQISAVVEQYGDIAHSFSTYQKRLHGDTTILGRGINSIQMVRRDGRWWVTHIIWDEDTGAGTIPSRYLPGEEGRGLHSHHESIRVHSLADDASPGWPPSGDEGAMRAMRAMRASLVAPRSSIRVPGLPATGSRRNPWGHP